MTPLSHTGRNLTPLDPLTPLCDDVSATSTAALSSSHLSQWTVPPTVGGWDGTLRGLREVSSEVSVSGGGAGARVVSGGGGGG